MATSPLRPFTVLLCPLSVGCQEDLSGAGCAEHACNEEQERPVCPIEYQWALSSQTGIGEPGQYFIFEEIRDTNRVGRGACAQEFLDPRK